MSNNGNGEFITIKEASMLTGKSDTTLYRYIKGGKIICHTLTLDGKQITKVSKNDLASIFNIKGRQILTFENHMNHSEPQVNHNEEQVSHSENHMNHGENQIEDIINKVLYNHQNQLMKPLEQQALYRLGRVEQENTFLKERIETLLTENQSFQEQIKLLPDRQEFMKIQEEREQYKISASEALSDLQHMEDEKNKLQEEQTQSKSEIQRLQEELKYANERITKSEQELDEARRPWWKKLW